MHKYKFITDLFFPEQYGCLTAVLDVHHGHICF